MMEPHNEKRLRFRRYEDRRTSLLLAIHEVFFDHPPGQIREQLVLESVRKNFGVEGAAFVVPSFENASSCRLDAVAGGWDANAVGQSLKGSGLEQLWTLQDEAPGAVTFARVKRPSMFTPDLWNELWTDLRTPAAALLSVFITPRSRPKSALWLVQASYSREWSSRDRELAEEVAALLTRAYDKHASLESA